MKKLFLALMASLLLAGTVAIIAPAAPASAATYSGTPTMSAPNVARGRTIPVYVNAHGSKIVSKTNTLWKNGRRVYDWSPTPGLYKVKSVVRYRTATTTGRWVWVPWSDCAEYSSEGYDANSDGDYDDWEEGESGPYDACAEGNQGDHEWRTTKTYGPTKSVTRYDYARVAADETPGCVSGAEFRAVKDGMTQTKVHSIFGTSGWVEYSGSGGVGREYTSCEGDQDWSYVSVDYSPRVWFKWRYVCGDLTRQPTREGPHPERVRAFLAFRH